MKILVPFSLIITLFFSSCSPKNRIIYNYLEDTRDTSIKREILLTETIIQKNDLLNIQVYSASLDSKADELYNVRTQGMGQSEELLGILVNQQGNIEFPRVGVIHAEGLTKNQLAEKIKSKIGPELTNTSVIVRFLNFRITVLGEVGRPGDLTIRTEKLTLLEALGMAGDITEFGKKKEVKILRENNGRRQLGIIDLTSQTMFESPYYQLQQNDVIMVEQTRFKVQDLERQRISNQISLVTGVITAAAVIISLFRK